MIRYKAITRLTTKSVSYSEFWFLKKKKSFQVFWKKNNKQTMKKTLIFFINPVRIKFWIDSLS